MQLGEPIHKTKNFFRKTLQTLKSRIFAKRLTKAIPFHPFSCGRSNRGIRQADQYYTYFCSEWEWEVEKAMQTERDNITARRQPARDEEDLGNECPMRLVNSPLSKKEEGDKEEQKDGQSSKSVNRGGNALAQKLKEFEMLDASNVEHMLDVEEALHYYSRLRSPLYLDMVDKFFTEMYTEISVPQIAATDDTNGSE